jgi:hypothetical protein
MKISGDFAVLLIFCCYVGIFCFFGAVNFVGLICCFVVIGLEDVSGRGKNNLLFCWWFFGQNENFRRFCCFVDILLLCWYFLLFRCCFVGLIWCFVVAGLEEVSGEGKKKKKVVPAKENTG